ncbi:hypothetical protein GCM10027167_77040 [Nocardia heshunensis]
MLFEKRRLPCGYPSGLGVCVVCATVQRRGVSVHPTISDQCIESRHGGRESCSRPWEFGSARSILCSGRTVDGRMTIRIAPGKERTELQPNLAAKKDGCAV